MVEMGSRLRQDERNEVLAGGQRVEEGQRTEGQEADKKQC